MKLTVEIIDMGQSARGGWTKEQLALIGVPWPPPKGWKAEAIGREVEDEKVSRFVAMRPAA